MYLPYDLTVPLLDIYLGKMKKYVTKILIQECLLPTLPVMPKLEAVQMSFP